MMFIGTNYAVSLSIFEGKENISTIKSWKVNFNSEIDHTSITSENVKVTDASGNIINSTVSLSKDNKSLIIDPPIDSYIPGKNYYVNIDNTLKSKDGYLISDSSRMKFTTTEKYEDTTAFPNLPIIRGFEVVQAPVISNNKIDFTITSDIDANVQYRVYIHKYINEFYDATYLYSSASYTELSNGFTAPVKGTNNYTLSVNSGLASGKYKIMVFVKRHGVTGAHKNQYIDYDNFYTSYLRVLDNDVTKNTSSNDTFKYINYNKTLAEVVNDELSNGAPVHDHYLGYKWIGVTENIISYYMNPLNFLDDYGKYMFLDLRYMDGVSAQDLNNLLVGKGVLEGKGQAFLDAAQINNINPLYLLSHSLLETGNGKSILAKGVLVSEVNGQSVTPKTVYNLYAVGAYDSDPNRYGSEYAYQKGWFSVEEALSGGAFYIGSRYINNSKYNQNTLYEMRYNTTVKWHQYSTDIGWAYKQVKNIKKLIDTVDGAKPVFEIPVFK